jgi:hypothetical protein
MMTRGREMLEATQAGQQSQASTPRQGGTKEIELTDNGDDLVTEEGFEDTTDSRNTTGNKEYTHPETGEVIQWHPNEGKKDPHYHRPNPNSTQGKAHERLDAEGNPIMRDRNAAHIKSGTTIK